ncbi:ATP-dependent DNA helicase [Bacillus sp. MRMR6]|uniref:ATP-dependent DNA helicase n=1 Tax=Bacillus sp. MRMR6 TaxID=1928617 RepID=UPI0011152C29|nr:ATP-dependent DNA helicase [Bacillus sp. MRMR6]
MADAVHISVRRLVEYVFSSGSIDSRFRSQTTLLDGTRVHQRIQKTYEECDQKEVYLSIDIPYDNLVYRIDGRCDGLLFRNGEVTIDEIKSTPKALDQLDSGGKPVHWAQAKMYAYIYASENNLIEISVQLTYVHVETEERRVFNEKFTKEELEAFVFEMIKNYAPYANLLHHHIRDRDDSSLALSFPFGTYRKGQRKLAGAVYKTVSDKKSLFVKAPTGIGKTMSTLFPAVKAIGEGKIAKIFYLTAKTITRTTAEEAFEKLRSSGIQMKSITITAKDKVCFKDETKCQKEYCEFADGYYDRINGAILDIIANETAMNREIIEKYAQKHRVCPFEFSIDLAYVADAVICDYNYIFDPRVSLKRLFEEQKKRTVLLVDEAHNLVDRGREMFSAQLTKETFLDLKREYKGKNKDIYEYATKVNAWFIHLKKVQQGNEFTLPELDGELLELLHQFSKAAEQILVSETSPHLLEAYFTVQNFLKIADFVNEQFIIYGEKNRNDIFLKLFCIDPSQLLKQMSKGYRSKIYFSATLSPMSYYQDLLGGGEEDYSLLIDSPFSAEQVDVYIKPLSTRYRDREESYDKITATLQALISNRPGSYLVFFPSYQYLLAVYEQFKLADSSTETLVQEARMSEVEREAFLESFRPDLKENLLGFAVLGGIFSEGIDLVGERLNGVIVVGVGLPQLCFERNLIKDHFHEKGKNGYDYAYVYPGMNKVLQAGGRLIRSEEDRGTIVLIDDRFLTRQYQTLLPKEWREYKVL